jgi:hypothetical protein
VNTVKAPKLMNGQAGGELADDQRGQEHRTEQAATDGLGDIRGQRIGIVERAAGRDEGDEVGHHDEDPATDQRDQHDGPRYVALRVVGFLGQGADRVEAEERIRRDRGAGGQRGEPVVTGERFRRYQCLRVTD